MIRSDIMLGWIRTDRIDGVTRDFSIRQLWDGNGSAVVDAMKPFTMYLDVWSEAIIAAGSYPQRIAGVYNIGGGPHFGSGLTVDTAAELYTPERFERA